MGDFPGSAPEPLETLRAEHRRLASADYFMVLGVGPDAQEDAIRRAYEELARRFDPRRYQSAPLEVRAVVADIMILVSRAHTHLGDAERRRAYREWMSAAGTGAAPRPLLADGSMRLQALPAATAAAATSGVARSAADLLAELQRKADHARGHYEEGMQLLALGDPVQAERAFGEASRGEPANRIYRAAYQLAAGARLLEEGNETAARRQLEEVARLAPRGEAADRARALLARLGGRGGRTGR